MSTPLPPAEHCRCTCRFASHDHARRLRAAHAGLGGRRVWRRERDRHVRVRLAIDHRGDHQLREAQRSARDVPRFSLLVADPNVLVGDADRSASSRSLGLTVGDRVDRLCDLDHRLLRTRHLGDLSHRARMAGAEDGRPMPAMPLDHQIEICSLAARIIGAPAGQLNACANSGTLASGPSTR